MSLCHNTNFQKLSTMPIGILWMHTSQYSQIKKNIQKYYLPSMKMLMYPIYASFFFVFLVCGNVWRSETIVYRMKMQCNVERSDAYRMPFYVAEFKDLLFLLTGIVVISFALACQNYGEEKKRMLWSSTLPLMEFEAIQNMTLL